MANKSALSKIAADLIAKRGAAKGSSRDDALGRELLAALKGEDPKAALTTLRNVVRALDADDSES